METFGDISVEVDEATHVALVEIHRPPNNFFSLEMLSSIADAFDHVDAHPQARAMVLAAEGKNFCAGAEFEPKAPKLTSDRAPAKGRHIYDEAFRLYSAKTPSVAAVVGAAVGGGLGLACMPDFRVGGPGSRFTANFAKLGFHQGFGLSVSLPNIVGNQAALDLLYTGRRIDGKRAFEIGLIDRYVDDDDHIRSAALELAGEIASSAPLALDSIRQTMRGHLAAAIRGATDHEKAEQDRLTRTADWREGVKAMAERRTPDFTGQ